MIKEVTMYAAFCDSCGKQWIDENGGYVAWTDAISAREMVHDDTDWCCENGKHYCKDCWLWGENDELVFGKQLNKQP